jgi:hypothetical protein
MQKLADEQSEEWVQRYYQTKQEQEMISIDELPITVGGQDACQK